MKIVNDYIIKLAETLSGHWYEVTKKYTSGRKRRLGFFPSSTTILNAYPQSEFLTKWIADQGWHESQRIKSEAGERGTRVHTGCDILEDGGVLRKDNYSLEEWSKLCTFVTWYNDYKPELIAKELAVFSQKYKYAGRVDRIYKIDGEIVVPDFKTSKNIYPHFPLQFSSYAQAIEEMTDLKIDKTAALQLGARNKNGYRYVLYPDWRDHLKVFLNVKKTWEYDAGKQAIEPPVLDLPKELKL